MLYIVIAKKKKKTRLNFHSQNAVKVNYGVLIWKKISQNTVINDKEQIVGFIYKNLFKIYYAHA